MSWSAHVLPEPLLPTNRAALHPVREKTRTKITLKRTGRQRRVESLGQMPATYDPVRAAFYVELGPHFARGAAAAFPRHRPAHSRAPALDHRHRPPGYRGRSQARGVGANAAAAEPADQNSHDAAPEQFRRHQLAHRRNGRHAEEPRGARNIWRSNRFNISHKTTLPGWLSILKKFPTKARRISASSSANLPTSCTARI